MKIGLVGWGVETQSVFRYLGSENSYVIANEHRASNFPDGSNIHLSILEVDKNKGDSGSESDLSYLDALIGCDKIYYTPVAWPNLVKRFSLNKELINRCTTMMQLFIDSSPPGVIIAVTGTKGKSTAATLIYEILKCNGKDVYLSGNIGNSPLNIVRRLTKDSIVVLELSSYQLQNLMIKPNVSVLLPITEEHLDWHKTMDNYVEAKSYITTYQTKDNWLIYKSGNIHTDLIARNSSAKTIACFENSTYKVDEDNIMLGSSKVLNQKDIKIKGMHNLENMSIALESASKVADLDMVKSVNALRNFSGLDHRLQFVAKLNGVSYYNDSIASAPEACLAGINSFTEPVVLAIGGYSRGLDIESFLKKLINISNLKHLVLFGEVSDSLAIILDKLKYENFINTKSKNVENVVAEAQKIVSSGDIVLLSPGFSSYDNYLKFTERGNAFKKAVLELKEKKR